MLSPVNWSVPVRTKRAVEPFRCTATGEGLNVTGEMHGVFIWSLLGQSERANLSRTVARTGGQAGVRGVTHGTTGEIMVVRLFVQDGLRRVPV